MLFEIERKRLYLIGQLIGYRPYFRNIIKYNWGQEEEEEEEVIFKFSCPTPEDNNNNICCCLEDH